MILQSLRKLDTVSEEFHARFPFVSTEMFSKMYMVVRRRAIKLNN